MNLGKVEFEKKLKIKDNVAYAYVKETEHYNKINGCDYFEGLKERNGEIERVKEELLKQIAELELEEQENKSQMLDLEKAGYCDLTEKVYQRVGGVVVGESLGHRKNCNHKGE